MRAQTNGHNVEDVDVDVDLMQALSRLRRRDANHLRLLLHREAISMREAARASASASAGASAVRMTTTTSEATPREVGSCSSTWSRRYRPMGVRGVRTHWSKVAGRHGRAEQSVVPVCRWRGIDWRAEGRNRWAQVWRRWWRMGVRCSTCGAVTVAVSAVSVRELEVGWRGERKAGRGPIECFV